MSGRPKRSRQGATLIPRLLFTVLMSAPLASAGLLLGAVGTGAIAAAELLIGKRIVDTLNGVLFGGTGETLADVMRWVVWLAVVMCGTVVLEVISNLAEVDVQERVGMRMQRAVIDKAHSVELVHFE